MSALIRLLIKRGVAFNVLRSQKSLQFIAPTGMTAPRLFGTTKKPHDAINDGQTPAQTFDLDAKPLMAKSIFDKLVRSNKVVVFMKGTPKSPRCGFSNAVVQIFRMHGVEYDSHDVLDNDEMREGIKKYTDWPTIPQVFINGEFIGGCDILLEMHQSGELIDQLAKVGITSHLLRLAEEATRKTKEQNKSDKK